MRLPEGGAGKGAFSRHGDCPRQSAHRANEHRLQHQQVLPFKWQGRRPGVTFAGDTPRQCLKKAFGGLKQGRRIYENHRKNIKNGDVLLNKKQNFEIFKNQKVLDQKQGVEIPLRIPVVQLACPQLRNRPRNSTRSCAM